MTTITPSLPLVLEDRTGHAHGTDFDDAYDRLFLRVVEPRTDVCGDATGAPRALAVYDMPQRWAPRRAGAHAVRAPAAVLRLGPRGALGDVEFRTQRLVASLPVHTWMPRTGFFAAHLSRQFTASDGRSYQWAYRTIAGHDWVCTDVETGAVCAHYTALPPRAADADKSKTLTILEEHGAIAVELLCALLVMRHIRAHYYA